MTAIAYDKGYFFLRLLEETVGRPAFDDFLKTYFTSHAFQVMDTDSFLAYLDDNLLTTEALRASSERASLGGWPRPCLTIVLKSKVHVWTWSTPPSTHG